MVNAFFFYNYMTFNCIISKVVEKVAIISLRLFVLILKKKKKLFSFFIYKDSSTIN